VLLPRHRITGLGVVAGAAVVLSAIAGATDASQERRSITLRAPGGAVVGEVSVTLTFPTPSRALAIFGSADRAPDKDNWLELPGRGRWNVGVAVWYSCSKARAGESGSTVWAVRVRTTRTGQRVAFPGTRLSFACGGPLDRDAIQVGACAGRPGQVVGAGGARARVCLLSLPA
jgi:hypothetical protein